MKTLIAALIVIAVAGALIHLQQQKALTESEFRESEIYLHKRIDSLKAMVLILYKNQDTMKADLDTLKCGQKIIFDEVKKSNNENFWSLF